MPTNEIFLIGAIPGSGQRRMKLCQMPKLELKSLRKGTFACSMHFLIALVVCDNKTYTGPGRGDHFSWKESKTTFA